LPSCAPKCGRLLLRFLAVPVFDHGEDFVLTHDEEFFAVQLDLLAGVLSEQNEIAGLDVERHALAVVFDFAGSGGDDLALLRLLFGRIGDDDAADLLFCFLDALDNDPVVQRSDFMLVTPSGVKKFWVP